MSTRVDLITVRGRPRHGDRPPRPLALRIEPVVLTARWRSRACALTRLLWRPLCAAGAGRVINLSSTLYRTANLNWGVLDCARNYTRTGAYAQSELALTMFTRAAAAASGDQILTVSVHPGVLDSGLLPLYGRTGRPIVEGADLVARLCDPGTALRDGAYDDGPAEAPRIQGMVATLAPGSAGATRTPIGKA